MRLFGVDLVSCDGLPAANYKNTKFFGRATSYLVGSPESITKILEQQGSVVEDVTIIRTSHGEPRIIGVTAHSTLAGAPTTEAAIHRELRARLSPELNPARFGPVPQRSATAHN